MAIMLARKGNSGRQDSQPLADNVFVIEKVRQLRIVDESPAERK